jgi:hypothetical protein
MGGFFVGADPRVRPFPGGIGIPACAPAPAWLRSYRQTALPRRFIGPFYHKFAILTVKEKSRPLGGAGCRNAGRGGFETRPDVR